MGYEADASGSTGVTAEYLSALVLRELHGDPIRIEEVYHSFAGIRPSLDGDRLGQKRRAKLLQTLDERIHILDIKTDV